MSEILRESIPRLQKFKKDIEFHNIPCFFSDSVKSECNKKIEDTLDFLGNIVRESVVMALEESRKRRNVDLESPMTSQDIVALEDLFSQLHGVVRAAALALINPIQVVEEWTVEFLGVRIDQGPEIAVPQFLRELVKKLLSLSGSIQDPFDELIIFERSFVKKANTTADPRVLDSLKTLGIHEPDATHIACAIAHSRGSSQKCVFVTLDRGSILSKKYEIRTTLNQICSDPLYAIYHLTT